MKIIVAEESGFCFGVKRAIDLAVNTSKDKKLIYTYGDIIHNKQVVEDLKSKGIESVDDIEDLKGETVVIRSHGAPKSLLDKAEKIGVNIMDGTCPYVKKIHNIVFEHSNNGYTIIIVGDQKHPEVVGITGWCMGDVYVVNSEDEINSLPFIKKACIVAQTTIKYELWDMVLIKLYSQISELVVFNTICSATRDRQRAALDLSSKVDIMLIIGGKHSSNTKKLYELCFSRCDKSYHIETVDELVNIDFTGCEKIGIVAGASTPDWIIKAIIYKIENEGEVICNG
jgi:4-hydroxy-3-methylbut-2-enyl diphosphate reductase